MTYNKPVTSGGVSRCVKCGERKTRYSVESKRHPRTIRDGCPQGQHVFASEVVQHGWSTEDAGL